MQIDQNTLMVFALSFFFLSGFYYVFLWVRDSLVTNGDDTKSTQPWD